MKTRKERLKDILKADQTTDEGTTLAGKTLEEKLNAALAHDNMATEQWLLPGGAWRVERITPNYGPAHLALATHPSAKEGEVELVLTDGENTDLRVAAKAAGRRGPSALLLEEIEGTWEWVKYEERREEFLGWKRATPSEPTDA